MGTGSEVGYVMKGSPLEERSVSVLHVNKPGLRLYLIEL